MSPLPVSRYESSNSLNWIYRNCSLIIQFSLQCKLSCRLLDSWDIRYYFQFHCIWMIFLWDFFHVRSNEKICHSSYFSMSKKKWRNFFFLNILIHHLINVMTIFDFQSSFLKCLMYFVKLVCKLSLSRSRLDDSFDVKSFELFSKNIVSLRNFLSIQSFSVDFIFACVLISFSH